MNRQKPPIDITSFRHLYPFRSHHLDIVGLAYHYLDEGEGDPILMIHGNPTWSFYFRALVHALSPTYRTIVPDHMGCGLSDKPDETEYDFRLKTRISDVETLLAHLRIKKNLTLVLHDWGGMIGMAVAVANPRRIKRLIVLNTTAFSPPHRKRLPWRLRLVKDFGFLAKPAVLYFNLFARGALYMASKRRLSRDVRRGLTGPYNAPKHRIATLKFVQDIPLTPEDPSYPIVKQTEERLHLLRSVPMLICWGKGDFVFDMDYLNEWKRRFPDAESHVFKEAGHYILEDAPDAVVQVIQNFLERHPLQ